ncbi:flavin-dependent oxidoreductase [Planomonospora venezuelensis]|uniref:2-polyprenyl-6-methoxyphenol hydroxylase-like FAD-dependent oxidoreductase n=1 Tax=Planomonospora venezuelensis TaxID=1999 RepID=A0A841DBH0_PLAVE|nr:flavin-dependent oxidoreductase [Planomonospora venezuelensis]MBB5965804.1 2-polyprenyl-6-methoxyphenol hydroxylase-like FAD-dependent oxidoreductase [Planomonospora venezuelensis]GIN03997.1 flavin-dependent oxidoreductase [Planomonospora venezuelensis]
MHVLVIGGGIGGLTTALSLHAAGIGCTVAESAAELRPLGVGINVQPHAVRELTELGLGGRLAGIGVATSFQTYADRFGGTILALPRGRAAGYRWPQYSVHRGALQMLLLDAVRERLGPEAVRTGLCFEDVVEGSDGVVASLRDVRTGEALGLASDVLVGADGVHSAVRARLHPDGGPLLWNGVRMWRGITESEPFLDGSTLAVVGSNRSCKFVAYPVSADRRRINWVAEVKTGDGGEVPAADWSREGALEEVLPHFADWRLPWLDVPGLLAGAGRILEYPMVDRDPLPSWGRGRVTLLGDAAHPMYPVGSNGGSQAVLDARVLARSLAASGPVEGLAAYEQERRTATTPLVLANREMPMERIIALVGERAPLGFGDVSEVLTAEEIAEMAAGQRRMTDTDVTLLNERPSWSVVRDARGRGAGTGD